MDLVVKAQTIPRLGQTVLGGEFLMVPGGKGANQAVAAARLGGDVYFVARVGDDLFADKSLENFAAVGVRTEFVRRTPRTPSGVALITVDAQGNNVIVVAPGANGRLSPSDVDEAADVIASAGAVAAQLEIPIETVERAAELAHRRGVPFILDPAPAQGLSDDLLRKTFVIKPNETEAGILTGIEVKDADSAHQAAGILLRRGVKHVIVTMGPTGFLLADADSAQFVAAPKVTAVDSTAAGDAFTGALAAALTRGRTVREAAVYAGRAAALSVTKMGAQPSMPTAGDVAAFAKQHSFEGA